MRLVLIAIGGVMIAVALAADMVPGAVPGFGTAQTVLAAGGLAAILTGAVAGKRLGRAMKYGVVAALALVVATDLGARIYTAVHYGTATGFFYTSTFYEPYVLPERFSTVNPFLILPPQTHPPYDAEGYRAAHPASVPPAPDEIRIFAIGGSETEGLGVTYPEIWENLLSRVPEAEGRRIRVFNAGRSGYSSNHYLVRLATDIVHHRPDIVTVMGTDHDIHELFFVSPDSPQRPRDAKFLHPAYFFPARIGRRPEGLGADIVFSPVLNRHRMANMIFERLAGSYVPAVEPQQATFPEELIRRGLAEYRTNLTMICRLARASGIGVALISQPMDTSALNFTKHKREVFSYPSEEQWIDIYRRYTDVIREVAAQEGATYIPLKERFDELGDFSPLLHDVITFTEEGSRRVAELSLPYIRALIGAPTPRTAVAAE